MLETKLIVDRFINLNLTPPAAPAYAPGDFVLAPVQQCYLQESTGVFTKTSGVLQSPGPKSRRNFKFLPWLSGAISEVALVGADVLTGPMSGCWLVTYRKPNGVPHAAHLGTDIADPAGTAAVNAAWNAYALAHPADVIGGFNPLRHWNGAFPPQRKGDATIRLFGLYTTTGDFYVLCAWQQSNPATMLRIAGIQQVNSVTVARLQQVDQPGP
jgi:hypothetical protein